MQLTAVFVHVPEGGYVAFVEELPGANTQARRWTRPEKTFVRLSRCYRGQSRTGRRVAQGPGRHPRVARALGMKRRDLIHHLEGMIAGCCARPAGTAFLSTRRRTQHQRCRDTTRFTSSCAEDLPRPPSSAAVNALPLTETDTGAFPGGLASLSGSLP